MVFFFTYEFHFSIDTTNDVAFVPFSFSARLKNTQSLDDFLFFFFCSTIIGRRKPASIRPRGDGVYVAEFTPQNEGSHHIDIQWSGQSVRQR